MGLGLVYAVLAVGFLMLLPATLKPPMASLAAVSAGMLAATAALLFRRKLPLDAAHPVAFGAASIVVINSLVHIYLSGGRPAAINLLLVLVGASCLFTSIWWFLALLVVTAVPWMLVSNVAVPGFDWNQAGFALSMTSLLSGAILLSRRRNFRKVFGLRASEEAQRARLAAVIGSSLDAIISIDHAGRITDFNPAAEETFGYSREEILGKELADTVIPEGMFDAHLLEMRRYLAERRSEILGERLSLVARRRD
ncbi:unnamed protein product, partial [marine sediment metagenome]